MKEIEQNRTIGIIGPSDEAVKTWVDSFLTVEAENVATVRRGRGDGSIEMKSGAHITYHAIPEKELKDAQGRLAGLQWSALYTLPQTHHEVFAWALTRVRSAAPGVFPVAKWVGYTYVKEK